MQGPQDQVQVDGKDQANELDNVQHDTCIDNVLGYPNYTGHHDTAQQLSSCNHQSHQGQKGPSPEACQIWHQNMSHYHAEHGQECQNPNLCHLLE